MSLQVIVTYLQGFLLIPMFGVEAGQENRVDAAPQVRVAQREEAKQLFQMAQQFQRTGLLEMAHDCYREAANRCPGTDLGRAALEQVNELTPIVHRRSTRTASVATRETGVVTAHYSGRAPQSVEGELVNLRQLRTLYLEAKLLVEQRRLRQAHRLFQKVHMIAPASRYGQHAVDEMHNIERQLQSPKRLSLQDRVEEILESTEPIEIHLEKPIREENVVVPAKFERQREAAVSRDYRVKTAIPSIWPGVQLDLDVSRGPAPRGEGQIRFGFVGCHLDYDADREERWRFGIFVDIKKH